MGGTRYLGVQHELKGLVEPMAVEDAVDDVDRDVERSAFVGDGRRVGREVGTTVLEIVELGLGS